jgi:hypothetical protein
MLGEGPTVSWHFGGVGPVVVATDEDDSHPATISAMPARIEGSRQLCRENKEARGAGGPDKRVGYIDLSSAAWDVRGCIKCATLSAEPCRVSFESLLSSRCNTAEELIASIGDHRDG